MVDGITIEIIGLGIGITGLGIGITGVIIAVYSVIKQRRLETKFKEKEKLKELSKNIEKKIIPRINSIIDEIRDPIKNEDTFSQLQMISQEVVSKAFDKKIDTISLTTEIRIDIEEKETLGKQKEKKKTQTMNISTENKEDIIKSLEEGRIDYIDISCTLGDEYSYDVNTFLIHIRYLFLDLDNLEINFGNLIDEFRPNLIKDLRDNLIKVFSLVLDSAIKSKEIEVHTKSFEKTNEIGLWIYNSVNGIDNLISHLDKLSEYKIKFDEFRETLIMTSYT